MIKLGELYDELTKHTEKVDLEQQSEELDESQLESKNNKDDEEKLAQEKSKESNPDDALLDPDVNQDPDIAIEEDKRS